MSDASCGSARHDTWRVLGLEQGIEEPERDVLERACRTAGIDREDAVAIRLARRSVDARRSRSGARRLRFIVHVDIVTRGEPTTATFREARRAGTVRPVAPPASLDVAARGERGRAVVIGAGPAGLFAAWVLARNGVHVDLLDRGAGLGERGRDVVRFHRSRVPDPESNLLFGEGGAGTYSDGKLYTRVDDTLEAPLLAHLVECGAPPDILYDSRAHIGTDRLHRVLPRLREAAERAGVTFHWRARVDGFRVREGSPSRVAAVVGSFGEVPGDAVFLAPGHSARDTWRWLLACGVTLEAKPFQLGVRIEHPQGLVDAGRYGRGPAAAALGPAYYNLVCRAGDGAAGAHSFCMCPGGKIVASVHESGVLCTNGMSNSMHSSPFANAAIVTTLGPETFGTEPLAGVAYQEKLERAFFEEGGADYTAPGQRADDFLAGRDSATLPRTSYTFGVRPRRIDRALPDAVRSAIARAILRFDRAIPGFAGTDGVLVGLESRSAGPVRIARDAATRIAIGFDNLYPIGEGAGYAGGIMSAAIDGARSALARLDPESAATVERRR